MKIIAKPKKEEKVLKTVEKKAKGDDILKCIVSKSECCVNHLCGCNCGC